MRRSGAVALYLAALAAAPPPIPPASERRVEVSPDFAVALAGGKITIEARPLEGETPMEFASRLVADPATAGQILALPGGPSLSRPVVVPYASLADEVKRAAVTALFPSDLRATAGWLHIAVGEEMALTLSDVLVRRLGLFYEAGDQALRAAPQVAGRMAGLLGWDAARVALEIRSYETLVRQHRRFRERAA